MELEYMQLIEPDTTSTPPSLSQKKPKMSIMDRVAEVEKCGETKTTKRPNARDPLEKYTKGTMPKVHLACPMAALCDIDCTVTSCWEKLPNGKLLIWPFGIIALNQDNHKNLKSLIFGTLIEITNAYTITVFTPSPHLGSEITPLSFIVSNLSEMQKQLLLLREVWSSSQITMHTFPFKLACPDYLFSIKGITTLETDIVHATVHQVWHDEETQMFMAIIVNQLPKLNQAQALQTLTTFIESLWVNKLDIKLRGNIPAPSYCIYTQGSIIDNDNTWSCIRDFVMSRKYKIEFQNPGCNFIPNLARTICHGIDHPRGLCPFPKVPGWNGPLHREEQLTT